MKAILVAVVFLFPCLVFGQSIDEKYAMYSDYLRSINKDYIEHGWGDHIFVVKVSSDDAKNENLVAVSSIINEWRTHLLDDKVPSDIYFVFRSNINILKDTLWIRLIEKLDKSADKGYPIKNRFAPDLHVLMLTYVEYAKYVDGRNFDWELFHENYSKNSGMVDLSDIIIDGNRAVFYCGRHNGPLNGGGELVFYYKDQDGWHFMMTVNLWMS